MCLFIYLAPYFKRNFIQFFLCLRTGVQGGGGYAKSVQVRTRGEGVPNFASFKTELIQCNCIKLKMKISK